MAANVTVMQSIKPTWHGQEKIVEKIEFETSPLNYIVKEKSLFYDHEGVTHFLPNQKALFKDDVYIKTFTDRYEVIQNCFVWDLLQESLNGVNYTITDAGVLDDYKKIFISVQLNDLTQKIAGEDYNNKMVFTNSFDGTSLLRVFDSAVRVVCQNTLRLSLGKAKDGVINCSVKHTANFADKIRDIDKIIASCFTQQEEFIKKVEKLGNYALTSLDAERICASLFANNGKLATQGYNKAQNVVDLFANGIGNNGANAYDLLNGVTEFYGRHASKNVSKLASGDMSDFGDKKLEFFNTLVSDEAIDEAIKQGEKLLLEYSAA